MNPCSLIPRLKSFGKSLLLGAALLLLHGQSEAQTFTNDIVDYGDGTSIPFSVLRTHTDGSVYALWRDGSNSAITTVPAQYKLVRWNGISWTFLGGIVYNNIPGLLSGFGPSDYMDLAIDSAGGFHVALTVPLSAPALGNGVVYGYSATGASGTWAISTVINYTGDNNGPSYVNLELDAANNPNIYVLQRNVTSVTPPPFTSRNYYAWHFTRSGSTWNSQQVYTVNGGSGTSGNEINEIVSTMDSNGKSHMLLSVELTGDNRKNITYATNASGAWVTQVIVPTLATSQSTDMDMVVDSAGKVHAIYAPITDRIVHYLTNRSGAWVDTTINGGALSGRLGATSQHGLSINSNNDLFFVYNSSPTSSNTGPTSYGFLPAATGNSWQTGPVMTAGVTIRTGENITTALTDSGLAMVLFEHFTHATATAPSNNPNVPRQLQYATTTFAIADTTAPDTTITATPANPSNSTSASFSFTGTDNVAVTGYEVSLDGGAFTAGSSPQTYNGLSQGSHTFQVRAKDAAGNSDATPASFTWSVDTTAPDTTITGNPTNPSNSINAVFTFTSNESPVTFQVSVDGGSFLNATSPLTISGLGAGSHTVQVRARDAAGNVDPTPAPFTWVVDTTAPDTTITGAPANPTNSTSATFSFTGNDGTGSGVASFQVQIDGGPFVTRTSPYTFTGLPAGSHTVQVRAVDAAGNPDGSPASYTWFIDTTPPAAPVVATPANGSTTSDNTPTYSGTAEIGSTVALVVDNVTIATPTATGAGTWNFTPTTALGDGPHTVKSRATDAAGNTGPDSATNTFTVDATPPVAPVVVTPANGSRTNDNTPTISGTTETGTTVTVVIDGTPAGTATVTGGSWTFTAATLTDASHTVRATASDTAGNASPVSNTNTFTVDTTPPIAPVVTSPDGTRIGDNTPLITGTAEANSTVTVYIDGAPVGTATAGAGGAWTYTVTTVLGEEAHTVSASATDLTGNPGPQSAPSTFYVDTTAPPVPVVVAPGQGTRTNNSMPVLHGTAEPSSTVFITLTGPTPFTGSTSASSLGVWVYPITTARADGEYSLKVRATDGVGNPGPESAATTFTVDSTKPTVAITSAVPAPVPLSGFTVTAQFSETVTDFSVADLSVTNASVSDFTIVDGATYTFVLTPAAPAVTVTVNIAAAAANDLAGNSSTVAAPFTTTAIDKAVSIAANTASVTEGSGGGTTPYAFTVSRSGDMAGPVTVSYTVTGSGAAPVNAADFGGTLPSGTVTIPAGLASTTLTLNVGRDILVEANETFTVTLSSPDNGYVLTTAAATGTITDDDTATLSVAKLNNGAEYPQVNGKFRITQSAPSSTQTAVAFTLGGTAIGSDFTPPVGFAVIPAGDLFADVTITVVTDQLIEGTETVSLQLGTISAGLPGISVGTPASASLDILDNGAVAIVTTAGTPQSAVVGTVFATPLAVRVNDAQGNPLQGAQVTFTAPGTAATGSFANSLVVATNASGIATASTFTAGTVTGSYTVSASVAGVATPASFALTNASAAAANFVVTIPATAIAGAPSPVTVTARDQYGNTATSYAGTVHLTSSDAAATLGANAPLANGTGTFSATFANGGSQTVTATDTVASSVTGISNSTTVTPQADLTVTLTDAPDPVQAGANLTYTLTLTNNGPSLAGNSSFLLPLPAGTTFVSATPLAGWSFIAPPVGSAGNISGAQISLPVGTSSCTITVKVGYVANNTVLTAVATANTATADPVPGNNSATATTTVSANPEIALHDGSGTAAPQITDGQPTAIDYGSTTVNNPVTRSFTVANPGNATLSLTSITVPAGFSLVAPFTPQNVAPTASFTFAVRYDAAAVGTASGQIVVANNDADESPFNFPITAVRTNVAPVAVAQDLTIDEDAVTPILLTGTDGDGNPLTFAIVDAPQHGTLTGTAPNLTYTPTADYNGADVFTFKANDGTADSATVEVNLDITPVNDLPRVTGSGIADIVQIRPDLPNTIDLTAYFSDPETAAANLVYTVVIGSSSGPVQPAAQYQLTGTSLVVTGSHPDIVQVTVTAADPEGLQVSDTFVLTTKRVPQTAGGGVPPTLVSPTAPTFDLDLAAYFTDGDGDALSYQVISNSNPGVLTTSVSGSTLTITPVTPGVATLTIRVTDSDGNAIDHVFEVTIDDPIPDTTPTVTSPPVLNRQTGMWEIALTATNNNQFNVPGFRFRVTSALPAGMKLHNSTAPVGSSEAYLDVLTTLTPGQSIVVVLEFFSPTRNYAGFNPTIIAEPLPEGVNNIGTGAGLDVTRFVNLPDGSKLMEFSSVAGHWYQIEYSSDLVTWKRSLVPVQAGANFTQWIDRGPPYTDSHPSTVTQRYYRVSEILPQ